MMQLFDESLRFDGKIATFVTGRLAAWWSKSQVCPHVKSTQLRAKRVKGSHLARPTYQLCSRQIEHFDQLLLDVLLDADEPAEAPATAALKAADMRFLAKRWTCLFVATAAPARATLSASRAISSGRSL